MTDILRHGCDYNYQLRPGQYAVFDALDSAIEKVVAVDSKVRFVSQNKLFDYQIPRDFLSCQTVYWADGDHLTEEGEQYFGRRINLLKHLR